MTVHKIPEKTVVTCDFCKKTSDNTEFIHAGRFSVYRHAVDMYNKPCARGDIHFDTCDACLHKVTGMLNNLAIELRK